jgi:hypothetical protein
MKTLQFPSQEFEPAFQGQRRRRSVTSTTVRAHSVWGHFARPSYQGLSVIFDVVGDIIAPLLAREGDALVVRPGHPERPIVLVRQSQDGTWYPVRLGPVVPDAYRALEFAGLLRRAPEAQGM